VPCGGALPAEPGLGPPPRSEAELAAGIMLRVLPPMRRPALAIDGAGCSTERIVGARTGCKVE
jgi:hypothetical protein